MLEVGVKFVRLLDLQKLKLMLFISLVDDVVAKFVPLFLLRDPATSSVYSSSKWITCS